MSRVPIRAEREKDIQKTILEGLSALRIFHLRMNSGAMKGSHKGKAWYVRFGARGMADILATITRGDEKCGSKTCWCATTKVIWLEVKRPGEKQTHDQIDFQCEVVAEGHCYFVVHSWEEALVALKAIQEV